MVINVKNGNKAYEDASFLLIADKSTFLHCLQPLHFAI